MKKIFSLILFSILAFLFYGCTIDNLREQTDKFYQRESKYEDKLPGVNKQSPRESLSEKPLTSFAEVADYISRNGKLPDNFITKSQARKLGWNSKEGNLAEVAPGKSIGGDIFTNREGVLPQSPGRVWREADIGYTSGFRGSKRILYSNDGLIYKTIDHYKTFTRIK